MIPTSWASSIWGYKIRLELPEYALLQIIVLSWTDRPCDEGLTPLSSLRTIASEMDVVASVTVEKGRSVSGLEIMAMGDTYLVAKLAAMSSSSL
ncbi:hypothetical protein ACLB2K_038077 [Fragaria x ananassa]